MDMVVAMLMQTAKTLWARLSALARLDTVALGSTVMVSFFCLKKCRTRNKETKKKE